MILLHTYVTFSSYFVTYLLHVFIIALFLSYYKMTTFSKVVSVRWRNGTFYIHEMVFGGLFYPYNTISIPVRIRPL